MKNNEEEPFKTSSVTVRMKAPPYVSPLPSSELSIKQVIDFVDTRISMREVRGHRCYNNLDRVPLLKTEKGRDSMNDDDDNQKQPLKLHLSFNLDVSWWSLEYGPLDGCLQYYANELRQKLRRRSHVKVKLPWLDEKLGHSFYEHCLFKCKFEYSGGSELIKTRKG